MFTVEAEDIYDLSRVMGLPVGVIRENILVDIMQFYGRND